MINKTQNITASYLQEMNKQIYWGVGHEIVDLQELTSFQATLENKDKVPGSDKEVRDNDGRLIQYWQVFGEKSGQMYLDGRYEVHGGRMFKADCYMVHDTTEKGEALWELHQFKGDERLFLWPQFKKNTALIKFEEKVHEAEMFEKNFLVTRNESLDATKSISERGKVYSMQCYLRLDSRIINMFDKYGIPKNKFANAKLIEGLKEIGKWDY